MPVCESQAATLSTAVDACQRRSRLFLLVWQFALQNLWFLTAFSQCGAVPGTSLAPGLQDCSNEWTATPLRVSGNLCARRNIFATYDVRAMELAVQLNDPPFSMLLELGSLPVAEHAVRFGWLQKCPGVPGRMSKMQACIGIMQINSFLRRSLFTTDRLKYSRRCSSPD